MRTTLNIDDRLMARVRKRAAETDRTITEVVEQALRAELSGSAPAGAAFHLRWTPVKGTRHPAVDLSDRDALYELMERGP